MDNMAERTLWTIQSTDEPAPLSAPLLDFADYSDEDLKLVAEAATKEIEARKVLREAPIAAEATARSYQMAVVRNVPAGETIDWTQPTGAHDAYPKGWRVKHNGKIWWSTIPANVWEPGVTGWTEERTDGGYPFWIQPLGAHDAYKVDAIVEHKGTLWINRSANNVWEPGVFGWEHYDPTPAPAEPEFFFTPEEAVEWQPAPAGYPAGAYVLFDGVVYVSTVGANVNEPGAGNSWEIYDPTDPETPAPAVPDYGTDADTAVAWMDDTEGYPEGAYVTHAGNVWVSNVDLNIEEPGTGDLWTQWVEPEPDPEPETPTYPEWKQPTGGHDAYKIGDRVMFQGKAYESKIDNNTWSPTDYPAGWTAL